MSAAVPESDGLRADGEDEQSTAAPAQGQTPTQLEKTMYTVDMHISETGANSARAAASGNSD